LGARKYLCHFLRDRQSTYTKQEKGLPPKNQIYSTVAGGLGVWAIPNLASRVELTPD
jgi:hypothetical protein